MKYQQNQDNLFPFLMKIQIHCITKHSLRKLHNCIKFFGLILCSGIFLSIPSISLADGERFIVFLNIGDQTLDRDYRTATAKGIVQLEVDVIDQYTSKKTGSLRLQATLDDVPFGPVLDSPPYLLTWDTTNVPDGTHVLSTRILDQPSSQIYSPFPAIVVVDNIPGPVTGPQEIPVCPPWHTSEGIRPNTGSAKCDWVTYPGLPPTPQASPRPPQPGIPYTTVLPEHELFQEEIMSTTGLGRKNHRFFQTKEGHVVAMPLKQTKSTDYRLAKDIALTLPLVDGPRGVGWVGPYIVGVVHPETEALIFASLANRVGEIHLDGSVHTIAGYRLKSGILPYLPNDERITLENRKSTFELVGNFVDGPKGLNVPSDITIDPRDSAIWYVADSQNHRIVKIDTTTDPATISTYAGSLTGASGFRDGLTTQALFNEPFSLVMDSRGNLFVADRSNNAIRKIDSSGNVTTVVGTGSPFWPGPSTFELDKHSGVTNRDNFIRNGSFSQASIIHPMVIRLDSQGNLILGEDMTNTLRKIDLANEQVVLISGNPPSGGAREWIWIDVDREGTVGPRDDIFWCASLKGSPTNEQWYRISADGSRIQKINDGLRFNNHFEGRFDIVRLPHYPWLIAVGKGALWLSGYGTEGLVRIRKALPTDRTDNYNDYNLSFRNGQKIFLTGTVDGFPWGARPSFSILHGARGWNLLGTSPSFDHLAQLTDAELESLIRTGWSGRVPRPEITGKDLRDLIYFIRRNSFVGVKNHIRPGPSPSDTTQPKILNITVTPLGSDRVILSWDTNELTLGVVKFGTTVGNYPRWSPIEGNYALKHTAIIGPLTSGSTYHYAIRVKDYAGNQHETADASFTMAGGETSDSTPPQPPSGLQVN